MWWFLSLLCDLALMAYAVYCLLLAYRYIGKPEGADPKYDSWFKQWSGTYKLLGGSLPDPSDQAGPSPSGLGSSALDRQASRRPIHWPGLQRGLEAERGLRRG